MTRQQAAASINTLFAQLVTLATSEEYPAALRQKAMQIVNAIQPSLRSLIEKLPDLTTAAQIQAQYIEAKELINRARGQVNQLFAAEEEPTPEREPPVVMRDDGEVAPPPSKPFPWLLVAGLGVAAVGAYLMFKD